MNNQRKTVYGGLRNKMKTKLWYILALCLIGLIAISGIANADSVPVEIEKVRINDREVDCYSIIYQNGAFVCDATEIRGDLLRGDELEVEVKLYALEDDRDVEIEVSLKGLDHDKDKARAYSETFKIKEGRTYWESLTLELPQRMDVDEYMLRIEVSDKDNEEIVYNMLLDVEVPRNQILIKDTVFSPAESVKAGRALYVVPRLKNVGDTEEDVKITVSIPELGISASEYIDEVEKEDVVTSEELYLRVPECAAAGDYRVIVTVEYDDGDESVSEDYTLTVVENEVCSLEAPDQGKTVVTIGSDAQDVTAGQSGIVYPIVLSNTGTAAKTYIVEATTGDWGEAKVSPSVIVLSPGETKLVYVSLEANKDATEGEKTFGVEIKSGDKTLKEVTLKANVLEGSNGWDKVRKGLEVALVVLVVLLVIVGLIIGFNRLKADDEEDFQEDNYY